MSDAWLDRLKVESDEDWIGKNRHIPYIEFDAGWQVKVMMPAMGVMVRFMVKSGVTNVSVYLDTRGSWEVYPVGSDVKHVAMDDIEGLLKLIRESIDEQTNTNKH